MFWSSCQLGSIRLPLPKARKNRDQGCFTHSASRLPLRAVALHRRRVPLLADGLRVLSGRDRAAWCAARSVDDAGAAGALSSVQRRWGRSGAAAISLALLALRPGFCGQLRIAFRIFLTDLNK